MVRSIDLETFLTIERASTPAKGLGLVTRFFRRVRPARGSLLSLSTKASRIPSAQRATREVEVPPSFAPGLAAAGEDWRCKASWA